MDIVKCDMEKLRVTVGETELFNGEGEPVWLTLTRRIYSLKEREIYVAISTF